MPEARAGNHMKITQYSLFALSVFLLRPSFAPAAAPPVSFNRDIRPILAENCLACHGPATHKAGLRLDKEEGLFGQRKGGPAIIRGDLKQSLLYQRISTDDKTMSCPRQNPERNSNLSKRN